MWELNSSNIGTSRGTLPTVLTWSSSNGAGSTECCSAALQPSSGDALHVQQQQQQQQRQQQQQQLQQQQQQQDTKTRMTTTTGNRGGHRYRNRHSHRYTATIAAKQPIATATYCGILKK
ncbi:LOW QUALITY PROTEIN: putative uncharacterized protein DDB_G0294196 [Drosophila rhopaloa]|uniref:Uncharacterized protein n=1 Tax=Drosophila rhopaloa TaxID=1041015 RepID=A0ABM5GV04_DRORH|nr:LOW QUALITY PROTEIN: putative uncharacterized protein DDB_G0294196 [Drosophila rhopaloa]